MLGRHDADREFGCRAIVRAVERDGSNGVAAKSSPRHPLFALLLSRLRACSIICSLSRVDDALRILNFGRGFLAGPERSRDCWLARPRCPRRRLLEFHTRHYLPLFLVPVGRSPRITPHRFSHSI